MLICAADRWPLLLAVLAFLQDGWAMTDIATFSDKHCQDSDNNLAGPDGYPSGTCTQLNVQGSYGSFQVVNVDPGCAVTIYGQSPSDDPCSAMIWQEAVLTQCYSSSWAYYSIDGCTDPSLLSSTSSTSSSSYTSSSTSSSAATSSTSTASSSPASSQSATISAATTYHGPQMKPAVFAGVAVGGVLGVATMVAIGFFLGKRRMKPPGRQIKPDRSDNGRTEVSEVTVWPPEKAPDIAAGELCAVPEIRSNTYHELPPLNARVELDAGKQY